MAVSRKVDRRAVGRNRIKRVVRESFRKKFASGQEHGGCRTVSDQPLEQGLHHIDIVVLPGRETATISNKVLFDSLEKHWSRLDDRLR